MNPLDFEPEFPGENSIIFPEIEHTEYIPEFPHPFLPNSPDEIPSVSPEDEDDEEDED